MHSIELTVNFIKWQTVKVILTMQILESKLAHKLTHVKITFSALYLNAISLSVRTGGFNGSTSGNLRTTSISFSTGFNSGLKINMEIHLNWTQFCIEYVSEPKRTYNFSNILIFD